VTFSALPSVRTETGEARAEERHATGPGAADPASSAGRRS
jgi:hypothetical protein